MGALATLQAHGYIFKYAREEMQDDIRIQVMNNRIQISYQSVYMGQIAPHVRLMIDSNQDTYFSAEEIQSFFNQVRERVNQQLRGFRVQLNQSPLTVQLVQIDSPTLLVDSLLAPLTLEMNFRVEGFDLTDGLYELRFDPRIFFVVGSEIVQLAKALVEFTDDQEKAIARYVQIRVTGNGAIRFLNTYPGRLRHSGKMVYIFGVFYDKTVLQIQEGQFPDFRFQFLVGEME
ncbi:MAG: hypothetical protein GXO78_11860 [Calditrichaeota bacterium]|nr:hypothetical protein [Calditrichota bacterium]